MGGLLLPQRSPIIRIMAVKTFGLYFTVMVIYLFKIMIFINGVRSQIQKVWAIATIIYFTVSGYMPADIIICCTGKILM